MITLVPAFISKSIGSARLLGAAIFLLVINLALSACGFFVKTDPLHLPCQHTWEWWRTTEYARQAVAPDVVLLGSSLIQIPTYSCEADFINKDIDVATYFRSQYLEDALKRAKVGSFSCFNFSLPGAMVSDNYMLERAVLVGAKKPKMIVLGMTLRDFVDRHCPCAASTVSFRYFQRFFNIDDIVAISMPEFWQRCEYVGGKVLFIVGRRLEVQAASAAMISDAVKRVFGAPDGPNPMDKFLSDINVGLVATRFSHPDQEAFIIHPREKYLFEDNSKEYRSRFGQGNKKLFGYEQQFLDRLLQLAAENKIAVVVANMPLTPQNMQLMPAGYYGNYVEGTKKACTKYGALYVDLNDGSFSQEDFRDTAHMNAEGGRKLLERVANAVAAERNIRSALVSK
jgi:hypothetical protein